MEMDLSWTDTYAFQFSHYKSPDIVFKMTLNIFFEESHSG